MRRTLISALPIPLALAACVPAHQRAPSIDNAVDETRHVPTLAGNLAATVMVYCRWYNPPDGETLIDTQFGVVLDPVHVITTACEDITTLTGWETAVVASVTVGPFEKGQPERGPWAFKVLGKDETGSFMILGSAEPLPLPAVVPGQVDDPQSGTTYYTVSSGASETEPRAVEICSVGWQASTYKLWPKTERADFFAVQSMNDWSLPAGVFDRAHRFVGFRADVSVPVVIPAGLPKRFQTGGAYGHGTLIATTNGSLAALLERAGIHVSE